LARGEKNDAWREASEAQLEASRKVLDSDWKTHQRTMQEIRDAVRNREPLTLQAPPAALYDERDAFYFPELQARSLNGETRSLSASDAFAHRFSLVGCAGSRFSEAMVEGWLGAFEQAAVGEAAAAAGGRGSCDSGSGGGGGGGGGSSGGGSGGRGGGESSPLPQVLRLSLAEGTALSWLRWPLLASMRVSVPAARRPSFMVCFGDLTGARRKMRMENRYLGYVCLVDPSGVVRWHVHSSEPPTEAATEALRALLPR